MALKIIFSNLCEFTVLSSSHESLTLIVIATITYILSNLKAFSYTK